MSHSLRSSTLPAPFVISAPLRDTSPTPFVIPAPLQATLSSPFMIPEFSRATSPEPFMTPKPSRASSPEPSQATSPKPSRATSPKPSRATSPKPSRATSPEPSRATSPEPSRATSPAPGQYTHHTPGAGVRPFSAVSLSRTASEFAQLKHDSKSQRPYSIPHRASITSLASTPNGNYTITSIPGYTHPLSQVNIQRQVVDKSVLKQQLKQQQRLHQKRTLPLFPTQRTRGAANIQNALKPVDITQIDLLPIEFSHKVIMNCIDEIKLRGLKHKHLFRNPFYSPSVEAALKLLTNPKQSHLFTIKMMRLDTVGGLLTTVLSRTFPPLIPTHIQELFQNPNGRFFFELLNMLPELNRFLFVEILDLCCDLADNHIYNLVSNSKLSVYPGSCCFGLDEYMPTWDTRYLLTTELKKFSGAFYHVIYAYREERDLSGEELQQKLDKRDKIMAEKRLEALELEHGLEGAHEILKREARIAKGLPPDSPVIVSLLPPDIKEVSLYAGRKERVVADDNISVLDIQLDDEDDAAVVPRMESVLEEKEEEEENVEHVMADLRKSVSVATLERYASAKSRAATLPTFPSKSARVTSPYFTRVVPTRSSSAPEQRSAAMRPKSIARFGSIAQNIYPVSPGDIFGISRHAIERRELQGYLSIARTTKKRKSVSSKRVMQLRVQSKMLRRFSSTFSASSDSGSSSTTPVFSPICTMRRNRNAHPAQRQQNGLYQTTTVTSKTNMAAAQSLRRIRTRQLRKELEVYLSRGLSNDEAMKQRKTDLKKQRRREKRAIAAAQAKVEAEARAELERAAAARGEEDVTMEEAEVMEAFDYLTDQEFEEFMALAGLTMQDVERIREKSAAAALSQVTKDIQSADSKPAQAQVEVKQPQLESDEFDAVETVVLTITAPTATAAATSFGSAYSVDSEPTARRRRPLSIPHMTSMDLLLKNATMIGDSNLRCYPAPPHPEELNDEPSHDGLLSQVTTAIVQQEPKAVEQVAEHKSEELSVVASPSVSHDDVPEELERERKSEDSTASSTETVVSLSELVKEEPQVSEPISFVEPAAPQPKLTVELKQEQPQVSEPISFVKPVAPQPKQTVELKQEQPQVSEPISFVKSMVSRPRQTAELKQEPAPRRVIPQPKVHSQRPISPMQSTELKQDSIASKSVPQPRPGHNVRSTSPKLAFELNQESARAKIPQPKIPQPKIPQPKIPQPKINTQRPASPTQAQEQKQESTVAKTVSQLPQSKANNQRVAAQKTPEPKQEPLRVKIQPIPKVANQRTPGSLQPTEVKQESTRTAGFPQSKVGSLRSVKLEAPAPATPTTPGSARAPGGVSALKNMFETSTRPTKPQASVVVPTGVSARRKLFEASQRSVRPEAPKLATAPAPTPAPAPAPALTPVPAPAPVPAPVKKVIKVLSVPEKKRANESTEGLQLLEVESDNDTLEEGDVKEHAINVKKDIAIDEEAAELRELLKSMTAEEREEFLRLSHEDALPASTVVVAGH